jgi:hypothetical protein
MRPTSPTLFSSILNAAAIKKMLSTTLADSRKDMQRKASLEE